MEDPTLVNGLGLGISAATDIATLLGVGALAKGSKALYKAYKAKEAISSARQLAAKQAANTYRQTRLARITDTATNKQVKSSIQSMLAKRLPSILPPLTFDESIETTKIYSISGLLNDQSPLITKRPSFGNNLTYLTNAFLIFSKVLK